MDSQEKEVKIVSNKNKSTKIRPVDHQFFRDYAHKNNITLLEAISIARTLLEDQYRKS